MLAEATRDQREAICLRTDGDPLRRRGHQIESRTVAQSSWLHLAGARYYVHA